VHLVNAYSIALADRDPVVADALGPGAVNFPDGKPLVWVSHLRRDTSRLSQIRGVDFMLGVLASGRTYGVKHFLLGSTDEVLSSLARNLRGTVGEIEIVGMDSPPFAQPTDQEFARRDRLVRESGAQIVWVGLGTPKQDLEAQRLAASTGVIAIAIGAAFDFAAGNKRESPRWLRRLGLEWLYRFLQEPRRLWRRYLFGNARFLRAALMTPRRKPQI
jgi:N-acetylglucosaminyldiphosphoundecaprenol N-acetyl-beta-D-mannosaminyltransferase